MSPNSQVGRQYIMTSKKQRMMATSEQPASVAEEPASSQLTVSTVEEGNDPNPVNPLESPRGARRTSQATGPPKDTNWLSPIVRYIRNVVMGPITREGETFAEHARKVSMMGYCFMSLSALPALALFPALAIHGPDGDGWTRNRVVYTALASLLVVHFLMVTYGYMRRTKTCPVVLSDFGCVLGSLVITAHALGTQCDARPMLVASVVLTSMTSSPRSGFIVLLHVLGFLYHYTVERYGRDVPLIQPPESPKHVSEHVFDIVFAMFTPTVFSVGGILYTMRQYIHQSEAARTTIELTSAVAARMVRFDVDGVEEVLGSFDLGDLQPELVDAFEELRENLAGYKRFIPPHVIEEQSGIGNSNSRDSDLSSISSIDMKSIMNSVRSAPSTLVRSLQVHQPLIVTTACVHALLDEVNTQSMAGMHQLIDMMVAVCEETKGALHHMHGDIALMSWNASGRVASHEAKAARSVTDLKANVKVEFADAFDIGVTMTTGVAYAQFFGTQQSVHSIRSSAFCGHTKLSVLARAHQSILTTRRFKDGAAAHWSMCAVAVLGGGKDSGLVYELGDKKPDQVEGKEWMYNLEDDSAEDPHEITELAIEKIHGKAFKEAAKLLEGLPEQLSSKPLVARVVTAAKNESLAEITVS